VEAEAALLALPTWSGASLLHERFAGTTALLAPPARRPGPRGAALKVSLHSLGASALQRRAAAVFPGSPAGAALLAAVTFQFLGAAPGGGSGSSSGAGGSGGAAGEVQPGGAAAAAEEMQRALEVFAEWAAAVRAHLANR
jgi:hypothetical protein